MAFSTHFLPGPNHKMDRTCLSFYGQLYALIADPVLYLFQSSGEACFASNPWVSSGLYCIVLHAKVFYVVLQVLGDVHEGPVFFWLAVTVPSATIGFRLWSCACAHLNTVLPPWHGKKSKTKKVLNTWFIYVIVIQLWWPGIISLLLLMT